MTAIAPARRTVRPGGRMPGGAARTRVACLVAAGLCCAAGLAGEARAAGGATGRPTVVGESSVLVEYGFDDDRIETGPDTFRVYEDSKGHVGLSSDYRWSGHHSVEIRDVAGDGEFPELQGYFATRGDGVLCAHFALLLTDPDEILNVALAGPRWFTLHKDGIAFWLFTEGGYLRHMSDGIPRKLFQPRPFTWYLVDVAYDIDRGTYDLTVVEEGVATPLVDLHEQPNAPNQPGSAVRMFSFIGDKGEDVSNVTYFVDDVVIGVDRAIFQLPFTAPGRRKLFVHRWVEYQAALWQHPGCLPGTSLEELGLDREAIDALERTGEAEDDGGKGRGMHPILEAAFRGERTEVVAAAGARLEALAAWSDGCRQLRESGGGLGDGLDLHPTDTAGRGPALARAALDAFRQASRLAPDVALYELSGALALSALGRHDDADRAVRAAEGRMRGDVRVVIAGAIVATARGDLREAEDELSRKVEDAGFRTAPGVGHAAAERYFHLLLWNSRFGEAGRFAARRAESARALADEGWRGRLLARWLELAGDAAFLDDRPEDALHLYETGRDAREGEPAKTLLLKLSDAHFVLGDLEQERSFREAVYGTLREP